MIIINNASYSNVSVTYTADGTQREFSFPFDYLRKAFVKVEVNEEIILVQGTDYTVSDNKTVVLTEAPESGTIVRVFRETSTTRLVSWADASVLRAKDMTIQQVQNLHILEEQQYWVTENAIIRQGKEWNARNFPIKNVGDPVDPKDATNKEYVDNNFMKLDDNGDYWDGRGKTLRSIEEPIRQSDGATKNYVDHVLAGLSITGDRVQTFNSVALMKEAHLEPGMVAMTTGYHNPNDGGAGVYTIRDIGADTPDGGILIEITGTSYVAELITDGTVTTAQLGLTVSDDDGDNLTKIANAFEKEYTVFVTDRYVITEQRITVTKDIKLIGIVDNAGFTLPAGDTAIVSTSKNIYVKSLKFTYTGVYKRIFISGSYRGDTTKRESLIIEDCYRTGNINIFSSIGNTVDSPVTYDFGFRFIKVANNVSENSYTTIITLNNYPWDDFIIENNYCHNQGTGFAYLATTNEATYASELSASRRNLIICNNYVENDDDFFDNPSLNNSGTMFFVLAECGKVIYHHNTVIGLKTDDRNTAVYHAYLSANDVTIENNTIKNCLNVSPQGDANQSGAFLMAKSGGKRIFRNNTCIVEEAFLQRIDRMPTATYYTSCVRIHKIQAYWSELVFENNTFDCYKVITSTAYDQYFGNIICRNNKFKISVGDGSLFNLVQKTDVNYSTITHLFEGNVINGNNLGFIGYSGFNDVINKLTVINNVIIGRSSLVKGTKAKNVIIKGNICENYTSGSNTYSAEGDIDGSFDTSISTGNTYGYYVEDIIAPVTSTPIKGKTFLWDNDMIILSSSAYAQGGFRFSTAEFDGISNVLLSAEIDYVDGHESIKAPLLKHGYSTEDSCAYVEYNNNGTTTRYLFGSSSVDANLPIVSSGDVSHFCVRIIWNKIYATLSLRYGDSGNLKKCHIKLSVLPTTA